MRFANKQGRIQPVSLGGDFSNIWQSSLSQQLSAFPNCTKSW